MKTIKEWVDTLPDGIRTRAYKYKSKSWLRPKPSLREAIMSAFIWRNTAEGVSFWSLVSKEDFHEARALLIKSKIL